MSSNPIRLTITDVGTQAAFTASGNGVKVEISHIAFGTGQYEVTGDEIALVNEFLRLEIATSKVHDGHISLGVVHQHDQVQDVSEIGVFLSDGTLFGVFSWPDSPRFQLSDVAQFVFRVLILLKGLPVDAITVNSTTNFELFFTPVFLQLMAHGVNLQTRQMLQKDELDQHSDDIALIKNHLNI